eukprot:7469540-Lingulodinium_polyedra.AAC.1
MVRPVERPPGIAQAQPEQWPPTQATELRGPFRRQGAARAPRYQPGLRMGAAPYELRRQGQTRGGRH